MLNEIIPFKQCHTVGVIFYISCSPLFFSLFCHAIYGLILFPYCSQVLCNHSHKIKKIHPPFSHLPLEKYNLRSE